MGNIYESERYIRWEMQCVKKIVQKEVWTNIFGGNKGIGYYV